VDDSSLKPEKKKKQKKVEKEEIDYVKEAKILLSTKRRNPMNILDFLNQK
jgi:hypothetical protein